MASSGDLTNDALLAALSLTAEQMGEHRFALIQRLDLWTLFLQPEAPYRGTPVVYLPLPEEVRRSLQRNLILVLAQRQNPTGETLTHLNLREGPGVQFEVVQTLPPGAQLRLREEVGDWLAVEVDGKRGYVHRDYVKLPAQTAPPLLFGQQEELAQVPLPPPAEARLDVAALPPGSLAASMAAFWNRYGLFLAVLAHDLRLPVEVTVAVMLAESGGQAFTQGPEGPRMVIRFENYVFFLRWGKDHPDRFAQHFTYDAGRPWAGHRWRAAPDGPWVSFHGDQNLEWQVYSFAATLDRQAARMSISMGLPQIMGFNHASIGYPTVDAMFDAFNTSDRKQICGLFDFIRSRNAVSTLRRRDYLAFAEVYNGPGQAAFYAARIEEHARLFQALRGEGARALPPHPATVEAPTGPAGDPTALHQALARLLRQQQRLLWLHQGLLLLGFLGLLVALIAALVQGPSAAWPGLVVGILALLVYTWLRPSRMQADFNRQAAEIERLLERLKERP